MGVRGLQSYLEQSCRSSIPIKKIEELAEGCRNSPNEELTIVVDGSNCIRHIYADLAWIGGAQLKEYAEKSEMFVQAFRDIGIRLVFFFDGPTVQKKRRTWVERRMATIGKVNHVLDVVSRGTQSHLICKHDYFMLPPSMGQQTRLIFEMICNCEVYQSVMECDEEIAEYARSNNVFGVLGHDSDYVIFDIGRAYYLDAEHLDLQTMSTRVYYPQELALSLSLNLSQLPLLATLMGNDVVKYDDVKNFHARLMHGRGRDLRHLLPKIVLYIKTLPFEYLQQEVLKRVAQDVLGNANRAREIETSVISYQTLYMPAEDEYRQDRERCGQQSRESDGCVVWRGRGRGGREWQGRRRGEISEDEWRGRERVDREGGRGRGRREWPDVGRGGREKRGIWRGRGRERWEDRDEERWGEQGAHIGEEVRGVWQEDWALGVREEENMAWLQLVSDVRHLHRNNKLPGMIYAVIKGLPFESSTPIEDYRITPRDLPIFAELTLELRQRLYGILLHQKPRHSPGSHKVEEWCMAGPGSLEQAHYNTATPPGDSHPGLQALWGEKDRPVGRLDDVRWNLFVHSVSPLLNVERVRLLPHHLVIPTLIVHHILFYKGSGYLEKWEAEVMLATAAVLHHYQTHQLAELAPDPMTSRSIRVANLIMRTSFVFYNLLSACGNPLSAEQTAPWHFFDGKLFQCKYREALNSRVSRAQLCENRVDSLEAFQQAWCVLYNE